MCVYMYVCVYMGVCMCTCVELAQDLRSRKAYATNKLPRLTAYLMKHNMKSILRPRTTSEGKKWMTWKHDHPCLVPLPLEIMFANTSSSKYLYFELGRYAPILLARRKYIYTYKRVVCVCLLVCWSAFYRPHEISYFAALPPSPRAGAVAGGPARHAQREHARACRTTSQRKNRSADACCLSKTKPYARMLSYT